MPLRLREEVQEVLPAYLKNEMAHLGEPKYRFGDRVRAINSYWQKELAGRTGVVAYPGEHLVKYNPAWGGNHWKVDRGSVVYWIDFGCEGTRSPCGAEVDEDALVLEAEPDEE